MEIRQLNTFKTVTEYESFHKAAKALHYAQSTVSAQVMALENELGVRLFERLGRRIMLTESGQNLYRYACKMVELAQAARADVARTAQRTGTLTIRVPESFCAYRLPAVVRVFRERMPAVKLRFITCAQEGLVRDLRKGVTDLAFLLTDSLQTKDLQVVCLGTETLVLVCADSHPLSDLDRVDTGCLSGHTLLLSRVDCSYRRLLEQMLQETRCEPGMVLEFNSVAAIIACVSAGVGLTVLPEIAVRDEIKKGRLAVLPWTETGLEVAQLMIWHRDKWLTPVMGGFIETVQEVLSE